MLCTLMGFQWSDFDQPSAGYSLAARDSDGGRAWDSQSPPSGTYSTLQGTLHAVTEAWLNNTYSM